MSCSRRLAARVCLVVWAVAAAVPALGQGTVIVPRPVPHPRWPHRFTTTPLVLKYQRVYADVTDGVAVTTVQQTFRNPLRHQVEGTYVFPLPDGVAVGDFSMTIGGKTLHGEVLDAETARRTYEDIVRRVKDPALLEYLGKRLWQAKIFPVPPDKELDVKLQYSQAACSARRTSAISAGRTTTRRPSPTNSLTPARTATSCCTTSARTRCSGCRC
jgi:Ca-activated chloride channel family protein